MRRTKKQAPVFITGEIMLNLPVRACSIRCIEHPEWGTFGVMEDRDDYYELLEFVLFKSEAVRFWEVSVDSPAIQALIAAGVQV